MRAISSEFCFNLQEKVATLKTRMVLDRFHDSSIPPISGFGYPS